MKKLSTLATSLMALILLFTMGACATSSASQQEGKAATEGFDQGKKLLDKSIKKDKPYSIDTARVYSHIIQE